MFNLLQMCFIVNYVTRVSHVIFEWDIQQISLKNTILNLVTD